MKNRNVKPNPTPARDAVIGRVLHAHQMRRGTVFLAIEPEPVKVIDFYPLTPSQQQRRRHGNEN